MRKSARVNASVTTSVGVIEGYLLSTERRRNLCLLARCLFSVWPKKGDKKSVRLFFCSRETFLPGRSLLHHSDEGATRGRWTLVTSNARRYWLSAGLPISRERGLPRGKKVSNKSASKAKRELFDTKKKLFELFFSVNLLFLRIFRHQHFNKSQFYFQILYFFNYINNL